VPVFLSCTASDRTPFYVFGNEFTGTNTYSIAGMKITGNIKYNRFDDDNSNRCLGLWNSNPNLYGNIFSSEGINIYLNSSYPKLSPLKNTVNQLEWEGGRNSFYSGGSDNIKFANASFPNLKKGRNSFTVDNSQAYHIYGHLPDSINLYDITYNCWLGHNDTAKYDFYKTVNDTIYQTVAALSIPKFCIPATVTGQKVSDIGNGIYDTILVTNDTSATSMTSEEILLAQANSSFDNQNYPDAITNYKGFIDNYPTSQFVYDAGYYLFDCYNMLDTSYNENTTDILFGDLKQFLNDKITSGNYDMDFKDIALFLILMCETRMENYEIALTGYEFIALYHPDVEQRMIASWDYEDIEILLGEGGGKKQFSIGNEQFSIAKLSQLSENEMDEEFIGLNEAEKLNLISIFKKISKRIDDDPVMKTMKENYDKIKSNREKLSKENTETAQIQKFQSKDKISDDIIISRARENLAKAKFSTKEEKELRRADDIKLLLNSGRNETQTEKIIESQPGEFKLYQNYPNPFNPSATISFSIPKGSLMKLKIYDITGREIKTLVNEFKNSGTYEISFNGSGLTSGVYFYKLQADNFSETRQMILIK